MARLRFASARSARLSLVFSTLRLLVLLALSLPSPVPVFSPRFASGKSERLRSNASRLANATRNAKENFEQVDGTAILAKVAAMPVMTWNYKTQKAGIRHIGPMAQDFKEAFGIGETDTGITTVDADGVALAAIQGLIEELKARDKTIEELKAKSAEFESKAAEMDALKSEMRALRDQVQSALPPAP